MDINILAKENFEEKQLAEKKGGLWKYFEYKEDNRIIVVRIYETVIAVDYYVGIDVEDSENAHSITSEDHAWEEALKIANTFYQKYEFKGKE